jgi:hypothetical protein
MSVNELSLEQQLELKKIQKVQATEKLASEKASTKLAENKAESTLKAQTENLWECHVSPLSPKEIDSHLQQYIKLNNPIWKEPKLYQEQIDTIPGLKFLVETPFYCVLLQRYCLILLHNSAFHSITQ